jgi:putative SOS response-associated peptidase YedK
MPAPVRAIFSGMCGRYATTRTAADLSALFEALDRTESTPVDYNVAPTDPVPVVRMSRSQSAGPEPIRVLETARWGLLPAWATDRRAGARMINARAETVATTRAYAKPFVARRCLIPADGWYEFAPRPDAPRGKQAFYMTSRDGSPMVFGGLWSVWGEGDAKLLTCSIVTREAIGALRDVHDRMPLILDPARWAAWLTGPADPDALLAAPSDAFVDAVEIRPVGPAVGDVRNDGPHLIEALPATAPIDLTLF